MVIDDHIVVMAAEKLVVGRLAVHQGLAVEVVEVEVLQGRQEMPRSCTMPLGSGAG